LAKPPTLGKQDNRTRRSAGSGANRQTADGFWDRPPLLNLTADLLLLFAVLTLAYALVTAAVRLPFFPLKQVVVVSALEQVTSIQIEYAAKSSLSGNFFTVDPDSVRSAFEKLPWVRKVSVRRRWPDGLELAIEEHVAAARWQNRENEARLVNTRGEVFAASLPAENISLPLFGGP
jgi:cell division protein FtsQ